MSHAARREHGQSDDDTADTPSEDIAGDSEGSGEDEEYDLAGLPADQVARALASEVCRSLS